MKNRLLIAISVFGFVFAASRTAPAQESAAVVPVVAAPVSAVPNLISYNSVLKDSTGRVLTGVRGVTFLLYENEQGGAPLWLETQNVLPDEMGHYTVQLGRASSHGLPTDLFQIGEARWLAVQPANEAEQPRVLLVAVPYALKAADAETVGGLPASAFVLAGPVNRAAAATSTPSAVSTAASPQTTSDVTTSAGGPGTLALWDSATDVKGSTITQTSGTTPKIGINTTTPATVLDVNGGTTIRGLFNLAATGNATSTGGKNSQAQVYTASAYNSGTETAVVQKFQWQAEPAGNNTATAAATLNLLFASGTSAAAETGLKLNNKGQFTFAAGQAFPGAGTIIGVTAGTDLTGGGTSGTVTLKLDTTKVPQLNTANTFTGNQTVNGNLSAMGIVAGSSYEIGSNLFAFGTYASANAFLGFAGNTTSEGVDNTASGYQALASATTGTDNTANGAYALQSNSTGGGNTAIGSNTLSFNSAGSNNTAVGEGALFRNTASGNTAIGANALNYNVEGNYNTAIGAFALFNNNVDNGIYAFGNTATGYQALYANTTGQDNTATGVAALSDNTMGYGNTADGEDTLLNNTTGGNNTALGAGALTLNTTGSSNTAVGAGSCFSNTTNSNVTCVGAGSGAAGAVSNATAIGAYAVVTQNNSLVLGGTGEHAVKVGIGVTAPSNILTIGRGLGHPVSDSWETYSSRRWKTNIHTLNGALGKVEQLRGVSYDLKDSGKHEIGVIAEEVGAVVPEVVTYEKNSHDAQGVDYGRLTALLIEAVKQQQREVSALRTQLRKRAAKEAFLESCLRQLERDQGQARLASARPAR